MLELRRMVGSLLVAGFDGHLLPHNFEAALKDGALGGLILFARNYRDRDQLRRLTAMTTVAGGAQALIAVDQEGGRVVRFDGDFPTFPSPWHYAEAGDPEGLLAAAAITARELRKDGVNLNLAPVCDLAPATSDHVLYGRAYSSDPGTVAAVTTAQVQQFHRERVLACAKHFPGLASAVGDPHHEVAHSLQSREEFRQKDYAPFRAVAQMGVDFVMTTHVRVDSLDPGQIATFSEHIIEEELRGEIGFSGLVISDDLQMLGALEQINQVEAGVRALLAGNDLLIYANLHDQLDEVIGGMAAYAQHDERLALRIAASYHRVSRFKKENAQFLSA